MLIINPQLNALKDARGIVQIKKHEDAYPRLYYTDFDGKTTKIKSVDVRFENGDVIVQTDLTDMEEVIKQMTQKLKAVYERDLESLALLNERIKAIESIEPDFLKEGK